ncbi:hypothetical protein [Persephonella sp. IF05-L8]|uniref:hypothetical protein n=1 Tax=Persephonella sp. IF05-L8 TaxID=1158338 RepID=UPI0004954453
MTTTTKGQLELIKKFFENKGLKIKDIKTDKGNKEYPVPFVAVYIKDITPEIAADLTEEVLNKVEDTDILVIPAK